MTRLRAVWIAVAALAAAAAGSACFSEKAVATVAGGGSCRIPASLAVLGSTVVAMKNISYQPASVTIRAGQRVTWVYCEAPGSDSHTSTMTGAGGWDSGLLSGEGQSFTHTFPNTGTFDYKCNVHPTMSGTVVVE
jgi:plastocyanin